MEQFKSVKNILDFAIELEQQSVNFYRDMSETVTNSEMKEIFSQFAIEEAGHKAKLQKIKDDDIFVCKNENIADLKISEYTDKTEIKPDMDYASALVLAMNREKMAFKLYTKMAARAEEKNIKDLFFLLAQEESKHKLRFEIEYDDMVMKEN
jgi:rubrerythrin